MQARRILSLDGGGIRGLVTCLWLAGVEQALAHARKPALIDNFDLLAGSSTGAMIACGLGIGLSPAQLAGLYRQHRHTIFPGMPRRLWSRLGRTFQQGISAPRYDGRGLEQVLGEVFGDATLGDLSRPTLVMAYDTLGRKPVVFKSFKPGHASLRIRDVCRASAAAPTYFPAHGMTFDGRLHSLIDGGVVANNPTTCAIAEALRKDRGVNHCGDLVVLSVGSGELNRPIDLASAREWGALEWAIPIVDVLFDAGSDSVDYIARQLVGDGYFRLQHELTIGLDDLDDTSDTNLHALENLARDYLARPTTQGQISRLVSML